MGFKWNCPECGEVHSYGGKATTKATARCGSRNLKIWQYRIQPPKDTDKPPISHQKKTVSLREDLSLGADFNRSVLIAGLMDTIKIYKNKVLSREGKILAKGNFSEGKKVLEWVEDYDSQKAVPMLVVHQAYFQKVDLAYLELKKLRV